MWIVWMIFLRLQKIGEFVVAAFIVVVAAAVRALPLTQFTNLKPTNSHLITITHALN